MDIEKKDRLKHLLTIANSYLALHTRTIHVWVSFSCFFFCFPLTNYADESMQLFMLYLHA